MNPDSVSALVAFHDFVRECLVDITVELPAVVGVRLALWMVRDMVVEDRPQDRLAVMHIMPVHVLVADIDDFRLMLVGQPVADLLLRIFR